MTFDHIKTDIIIINSSFFKNSFFFSLSLNVFSRLHLEVDWLD